MRDLYMVTDCMHLHSEISNLVSMRAHATMNIAPGLRLPGPNLLIRRELFTVEGAYIINRLDDIILLVSSSSTHYS